jgi:hypothetical protein
MEPVSTQQTSVDADVQDSLDSATSGNSNPFREPTFFDDYYRYLTNPGDMDSDLKVGFYVAGGIGLTAGAAAGGVLIAGSIAGASLVPVGGLATAATGVPTMAGNAVIGMGSAGLIGGTVSAIGGGNFISGGVTAAPGGFVGGAASSVASSLLARAGFSGLLGAITSDGIGGAAAAAVDSRLKGNTLGQTLTASFYGFVTGGTLRAGLHYAGPLVKQWWTSWTPKTSAPSSPQRTNAQLVDDIATRAKRWVERKYPTGTPTDNGTRGHKYAKDLLDRYQQIFGDRGLKTEISFIQGKQVPYGTKGSTRLDVLDVNARIVWDYKFGAKPMSKRQIERILQAGPRVTWVTQVHRP